MSIVQTLRNYLDANKEFKLDFQHAFKIALTYKIQQFEDFGIKTFDQYLDYYETFLRWVPTETRDGKNVYYHLCIFYFVLDLPPMMKHQADIHPRSHWTWLSQWIIDFSVEVGKFHDSEASLTEESLQTFKDSPPYRVHDYIDDGWKTFNDFFARKLKAGMRHWDQDTATDIVITQPADSMFGGVFPVDDRNYVELKGIPWNICQLLDDTLHGGQFAGGQFTHSFLNTFDYHRQHAPVSGTIVDARVIPGLCYLEVVADPPAPGSKRPTSLRMRRKLAHHPNHQAALIRNASGDKDGMEAPDSPGYQFLQARGVIVIDNPDIGLVAVLPVGMAQVSSVRLSVEVGQQVQKGDEISYFQMGGSDCIIVFQGGVEINFTAKAPDPEPTKYLVGNQIATARKGQRNAGIGPRSVKLDTTASPSTFFLRAR